ncbi:MAG TPA: MBL fold metallo-hydrolase [Polyangiaceae bacterium]|jgi:glyoxylase-like metal-dependent hydrolase (beta-lactamase superfamily II)
MTISSSMRTPLGRLTLASGAIFMLLACSTARPSKPPLIEQRSLAALMETAAYPNSQTLLLLVTMQQFVSNHQEWQGYDYFGRLAREQPERRTLFRSLQAVMQARVARDIGLLKRVAWVEDAIQKLDEGATSDPLLGRFARGQVFAELPARFDKARTAVSDLQASLEHRAELPFGLDRGIYRGLAAAYRTLGDDAHSREMLRRAGLQSLDDATVPRVIGDLSVDADDGFRFREKRLVREADGVYVAEGYDFANLGFIVTPGFVVAIDAGTTEESTREALAALRQITRAPIKYIILTHGHWDHVGGLAALREPGSVVIAQAGFAKELERSRSYHPPFRYFFGSGTMKLDAQPERLISASEALTEGELDLQLIPAKSGETDDALFIQDRKHDLLFVGDSFMPYLGAPFVAEGSPEGYLGAIAQVLELHPRRLIHGHPPLSALFTIEAMPGLRDAAGELYQHTLSAARAARPLAELLHDNLLPASLRSAPAAVQPYLIMRDTFIQRVYAEHAGYWQANGDGMDHFTRAEWAAALDTLGIDDAAYARAAVDLEARGDATLALHIAELGLARYPASQALQKARQGALTSLQQMYAQTNPFRFIVYSEFAGRALEPVALPTR